MSKDKHFEPGKAIDARAARDYRSDSVHERKLQRVSNGLARYAVRQANRGYIDEEIVARSSGLRGRKSFIRENPAVYDMANQILAGEGLTLTNVRHHEVIGDLPFSFYDKMTIEVLPGDPQKAPVNHADTHLPI